MQDGEKWKENHATKVTKIPKTKRRKYGMNETLKGSSTKIVGSIAQPLSSFKQSGIGIFFDVVVTKFVSVVSCSGSFPDLDRLHAGTGLIRYSSKITWFKKMHDSQSKRTITM